MKICKKITFNFILLFSFLFIAALVNKDRGCSAGQNRIIEVIDGDTVKAEGFNDNIRILGIDAFDKSSKQVKKQMERTGFSMAEVLDRRFLAKSFAEEKLLNKCVTLAIDKGDRDLYGRFLRYVFIGSDTNNDFSEMILKEGLAMVYCENKKVGKFNTYLNLSQWKCQK